MRILTVFTVLGIGQLVSTKTSLECIPKDNICDSQHNLACGKGLILVEYIKLKIGQQAETEGCECNKEEYVCLINGYIEKVKQICDNLEECRYQVEKPEHKYIQEQCRGQNNKGPLQAISSNITYRCIEDEIPNRDDSDTSAIIIASTGSALVVVTIVLIVFVVVFVYKRKTTAKKEDSKNEMMRAATFRHNAGFEGDYVPIPEDYDRISRLDSQHVYHTLSELTRLDTSVPNGHHSSVNTAANDDYDTANPDGHKQLNDKDTYTDSSTYTSTDNGGYNKLNINKIQNVPIIDRDYSHMNQQEDDYSHLGDSVDNLQPAVNDYNRLHEKMKKEENYDDAITQLNVDCNDENDANVKTESLNRKGSNEEPGIVGVLNTDHIEADDIVPAENNDQNSLTESSDLTNEDCALPQKVVTDDSGADSNSKVSCDSLQSEEVDAKLYEHDSAENTTLNTSDVDVGVDIDIGVGVELDGDVEGRGDVEDGAEEETKNEIRADNTSVTNNDLDESTSTTVDLQSD